MFQRLNRYGLSLYTVVLLVLWLILAVYFITHPDPISIIALIVSTIVAAAAIVISLALRRAQLAPLEHDKAGVDDASPGAANGHYAAGANGAQQHETDENPAEGGHNS